MPKMYSRYHIITLILLIKNLENKLCSPIVKGFIVEEKGNSSYNFIVSLQEKVTTSIGKNEYRHLCGGAFINEYWIITAAHCVYDRNSTNLFVQIGFTISNVPTQSRKKVQKVEMHRYNEYTMRNDIALIQVLPEYKNFISYLKFANEIELESFVNESTFCKILGFGSTIYGGNYQNNLHEANVKLISNQECVSILGHIMAPGTGDNTVCAVGLDGEDVCQGDSGGPLICSYNNNDYLYGIVSYGLSCGERGVPSVYTIVEKYIKWINKIVYINS